ncbi:uncharacterized protein LOC143225778 [Tachypleus tridentatus]|uniref:uncharacterized protein LOC143225778 n=1 Tax=Tachypleus tridentatus TaxID=6853 RepID=UPI003FD610D0
MLRRCLSKCCRKRRSRVDPIGDDQDTEEENRTMKTLKPLSYFQIIFGINPADFVTDVSVRNTRVPVGSASYSLILVLLTLYSVVVSAFRYRLVENNLSLISIITAFDVPFYFLLILVLRVTIIRNSGKYFNVLEVLHDAEIQLRDFLKFPRLAVHTGFLAVFVMLMALAEGVFYLLTLYYRYNLNVKDPLVMFQNVTNQIFIIPDVVGLQGTVMGAIAAGAYVFSQGAIAIAEATLFILALLISKAMKEVKEVLEDEDPTVWKGERLERFRLGHWLLTNAVDKINESISSVVVIIFIEALYILFELYSGINMGLTNTSCFVYLRCLTYGIRFVIITIMIAEVPRKAEAMAPYVQRLPVDTCTKETCRFLEQTNRRGVAITGRDFFVVNRKFLLAFLGGATLFLVILLHL